MRQALITSLALMIGFIASDAFAGRIFGDIRLDGKLVPAGLPVWISLVPSENVGGETSAIEDSTATDEFGSYKLNVKPEGKCILTLVYEKQPLTLEVFSYKEATRYSLILAKMDGKFSLRRK